MADEQDSWISGIGVDVGDFVNSAGEAVAGAASTVQETVSSAADTVQETVTQVAQTVEETAAGAEDEFQSVASGVWDSAQGAAETVAETASDAAGQVQEAAGSAWESVQETVSETVDSVEETASSVADSVQETVSDAADSVEEAVSDVVDSARETASGTLDSAIETAQGIVQTVETTASGAMDEAEDIFDEVRAKAERLVEEARETAEGALDRAREAAEETAEKARALAEAALQEVEETATGIVDTARGVVDKARETARKALEEAEKAVGDAADEARKRAQAAVEKARELARKAVETARRDARAAMDKLGDMAADARKAVMEKLNEAIRQAEEFAKSLDLPYQFGGIQAPFLKSLEEIAGRKVEARGLTGSEKSEAETIFGDSLDYGAVVVDGGSIASIGSTRTIGNTIHMEPEYFEPDSSETTTEGRRIVVHELTHVWQYQHHGWDYIPKSLWEQAKGGLSGSRNQAYEWQPLARAGTPFEQWNPEQQAMCVEDYNRALQNVKAGRGQPEDFATLSLAAPYVRQLAAGPGKAPPKLDSVLNSASDMSADVRVSDDGSWTATWSWVYQGTEAVFTSDVQEDFLLTDARGTILDAVRQPGHGLMIGTRYMGSIVGRRKIPGGQTTWKLHVPYQGGYIGVAGGSFFAMVAITR